MVDSHPVKLLVASDVALAEHPFDFHALGLAGVIDRLGAKLRSTGLSVALEVEHADAEVDRRTAISLYRATDEIFRNILAHAVARKVAVRLKVEPGSVRVCVQDDGVGFDRSPSGDATEGGLRRLQREVSLAGGYLDVQSRPGTGTFVIVQLPLE